MKIFKKLQAIFMASAVIATMLASAVPASAAEYDLIDAVNPDNSDGTYSLSTTNVRYLGRTYEKDGGRWFNWNNSGFEFSFYGTKAEAEIFMYYNYYTYEKENSDGSTQTATDGSDGTSATNYINVYIDGNNLPEDAQIVPITSGTNWVTLCEGLEEGYHTVTVRTPTWTGERFMWWDTAFNNASLRMAKALRTDGTLCEAPEAKALSFEAIGDSITNGDSTWSGVSGAPVSWSTWAAYTARYFDADLSTMGISGNGVISWVLGGGGMYNLPDKYPYTWTNGCVDENGNAAQWDASNDQVDVVMINLGTNDRGNIDNPNYTDLTSDAFITAYVNMMKTAKEKNPDAIFVCMLGAMGYMGSYADIQELVKSAVEQFNTDIGEECAWYISLPACSTLDFDENGNIDNDGDLDEDDDGRNDGLGYDNGHPSIMAHKYYSTMIIDLLEPKLTELGKWDGPATSILGAQTRVSAYTDANGQPTMDMRFVSTIDTDLLDDNLDNIVDIGVLVGKESELDAAGLNAYDITLDSFDNAASLGITLKKAETTYMYNGYVNAAQSRYRFYATLVGIDHNMYTSTYVARAYVTIDNGDGTTSTRYSRPIKRCIGKLPIGGADVEGSVEMW